MKPKCRDFKDENDECDWDAYGEALDDWGDAKYEEEKDRKMEEENNPIKKIGKVDRKSKVFMYESTLDKLKDTLRIILRKAVIFKDDRIEIDHLGKMIDSCEKILKLSKYKETK